MTGSRDDLREALARDLTRAAASIESSRTGLGVNGGLVSALGRLTFQNLPLILDALAQVSALQAEVERLQKVEGERDEARKSLRAAIADMERSGACKRVYSDQALGAELERVEAERNAAVEALKPFAGMAAQYDGYGDAYQPLTCRPSVGMLRAARSAVTETKEGENV